MNTVEVVRVFPETDQGGNPAPIVVDADDWTALSMRAVAQTYGHESGFVLKPEDPAHNYRFRFFVPNHEMEMCGHATLGALWLLRRAGRWQTDTAKIETLSGIVDAYYDATVDRIQVSQPSGTVQHIGDTALVAATLDALNLTPTDVLPLGIVNATTSRTKTLVPIISTARLDDIAPKFDQIARVCEALLSTGLYPFAVQQDDAGVLHARQFPRASGYPEDAATGIAAAALLYGAQHYGLLSQGGNGITVRQGIAMGRPSAISLSFRHPGLIDHGCWMTGAVALIEAA